jgi:hypothetical protein
VAEETEAAAAPAKTMERARIRTVSFIGVALLEKLLGSKLLSYTVEGIPQK